MSGEFSDDIETPIESGSEPNDAQAAFSDYIKRMDAYAAEHIGGGIPMPPGPLPPPPPFSYGMPGWVPPVPPWAAHPQQPMHGQQPGMPQGTPWAGPPPPQTPPTEPDSRTQSLLESVGSLIRLGIDALNVGLAGGIQLMEGISGMGPYGYDYYDPYPMHYAHFGHHDCYDYYLDDYDPHYANHHGGCHSSVHDCQQHHPPFYR